jgi:hypothetical protein
MIHIQNSKLSIYMCLLCRLQVGQFAAVCRCMNLIYCAQFESRMPHDGSSSWIHMVRSTPEWQKGFNDCIKSTFTSTYKGETAPCPCSRCAACHTEQNLRLKNIWLIESEVEKHLVDRGFAESFITAEHNNVEGSVDEDEGFGNDGITSDGSSMKDLV